MRSPMSRHLRGYGQKLVLVGSSSDRQPFIFRCFVFFDLCHTDSSASSIGLIMYQQKVYIKCLEDVNGSSPTISP